MDKINLEGLSQEIRDFIEEQAKEIDRVKNTNGQTARANAIDKLKNDEKFRKSIADEERSKIEEEARLTGEERLKNERDQLQSDRDTFSLEKNKFTAQRLLNDIGIKDTDKLVNMLASPDIEKTEQNVSDFIETFNVQFDTKVASMKQELLGESTPPNTGGNTDSLQSEYSNAVRNSNLEAQTRLILEAHESGTQLNAPE